MRVLVANCDFDENPRTNGAELLRQHLSDLGASGIIVRDIFRGQTPSENELKECNGAVITGSRASVYGGLQWVENLLGLIRTLDSLGMPVLGICFGFQAVAEALGGSVISGSSFREGFEKIELTQAGRLHRIFRNMPPAFSAYHSHGDLTRIPEDSEVLAVGGSAVEAYAIRNFACVQFHPEILPPTAVIMAERDGKDAAAVLKDTSIGYSLTLNVLSNFIGCKLTQEP